MKWGVGMKYYDFSTGMEQEQVFFDSRQEKNVYRTPGFSCAAYLDLYDGNSCLWHWHDEMEAGYVTEGELTVFVNDLQYTLRPGDGIFVNAGVLHSYSGIEGRQTAFANLVFLPSLVYGSKESIFWTDYVQPLTGSFRLSHVVFTEHIAWQAGALGSVRKAFQLFRPMEAGNEFAVRTYLSELILAVCRNCPLQRQEQGQNVTQIRRMQNMLVFMESHYMEPIRLQHIADSAGISCRECLRIFHDVARTSPKRYLNTLRLQKAKQLLAETTVPVSQICVCCGFADQSYFTKMFRQQFGMPPGAFRQQEQG